MRQSRLTQALLTMRAIITILIANLVLPALAQPGHAESADSKDKSSYTLFSPTPDKDLRDLSPDRPARADTPYTVDAGHFQIETDFINVTRSAQDGMSTHLFQTADPTLKLGLTNDIDIEVTLGGYNTLQTLERATGRVVERGSGYGDTTVTTKFNLLGNDSGKIVVALAPFITLPTGARAITNGTVEGGVIAPVLFKLPQDFELTLQSEVGVMANQNGPGTHGAFTDIAELSHPIPSVKDLTAYVEFFSQVTPARNEDNQYSFDVALAYQVGANTQLDIGANLGLNRGTPGTQVYSGVAQRF